MALVKIKKLSEIPINLATKYAAEDTDITFRLWKYLDQCCQKKVSTIYNNIEINLISVLAKIELNGIRIDENILFKFINSIFEQIKFVRRRKFINFLKKDLILDHQSN